MSVEQKYLSGLTHDLQSLGFPSQKPIGSLVGLIGTLINLSDYTGELCESNPETDIGRSIQARSKLLKNRNPFSRNRYWLMCAKAEPLFLKCVKDAEDSKKYSPILVYGKSNKVTGLIKPHGEPTLYIFGDKSGEPSIDTIGSSAAIDEMFGDRYKPSLLERRAGAYAIASTELGQLFDHRPSTLSVPGEVRNYLGQTGWNPFERHNVSIKHTPSKLFERCQRLLGQPETKNIKLEDLRKSV